MKTIVFDNLRDAKTGKILNMKVRNRGVKQLDLVAQMAKKSAQEFKKMVP